MVTSYEHIEVMMFPSALPLLTLKDNSVLIQSLSDVTLSIPIILQPDVNCRDIILHHIFKGQKSLFNEYIQFQESTSPISTNINDMFLHTKMEFIIFSLKKSIDSSEKGFPVRSIFPKNTPSEEFLVVPPFLSEPARSYLHSKQLNTTEIQPDSVLIQEFIKHILSQDLTKPCTAENIYHHYFQEHLHQPTPSHCEIYVFLLQNISKKFNLYLGIIEGNHRSVSIHFAMKKIVSTNSFGPTYNNLATSIPASLYMMRNDPTFFCNMQQKSEEYITSRMRSVPFTIWNDYSKFTEFLVLEWKIKEPKPIYKYQSIIDHYHWCSKTCFNHFSQHSELWKVVLNTDHVNDILKQLQDEFDNFEVLFSSRLSTRRARQTALSSTNYKHSQASVSAASILRIYFIFVCMESYILHTQPSWISLTDLILCDIETLHSETSIWISFIEHISYQMLENKIVDISCTSKEKRIKVHRYIVMQEILFQFWGYYTKYKKSIDFFGENF